MRGSSGVAGVTDGDCVIIRFSTTDYPPHERLDACREIYGRTLSRRDIEPLSTEQFHTEATIRRMPGLGLVRARRSAAIYRLRREFIDNDDVVITVGLTSGYEAHQCGRLLNLSRGEASVLTASEPAFLKVPTYGEYINVRAPLRALSPLVAGAWTLRMVGRFPPTMQRCGFWSNTSASSKTLKLLSRRTCDGRL